MSWGYVAVAGATLVTGYMNKKSSDKAAKAAAGGADQSAQVQWDMFNQNRQDMEPWRQAGLTGLQEYMALLGLPGSSVSQAATASRTPTEWFGAGEAPTVNATLYASDPMYRKAWDEVLANHQRNFGQGYNKYSDRDALQNHMAQIYGREQGAQAPAQGGTSLTQQDAFARFRNQPGYQFGLSEGVRALDSSATASGGLFSGKAAKALTRYGQDYADQQGFTPYMNRIASLAGIGQTATGQIGQYGQATANNVGNALQNAGNARASGIVGGANAWNQAINQGAGMIGYMQGRGGGNSWGWGGV